MTPHDPPNSSGSQLGLRTKQLALGAGTIAYVDEGGGPPVLLLHGAPMTSLAFVRVIRRLRERYRVVAPDLPGFGQSRAAPSFAGSLAEYARSIEELLNALDLSNVVVFGCDASVCAGLAAAASMPDRVAGLVIAGTVPLPLTGSAWLVKMVLKHVVTSGIVRLLNRRWNLLPWLVARVAPFRRPFSAPERAVMTAQFDTAEKRERALDLMSAMARDESFVRATCRAVSARLADKPTLLLYGQFDPMRFVGAVARFRRMFTRSLVHIVAWEEHFPMLAEGAQVAHAIETWADSVLLHESSQPREHAGSALGLPSAAREGGAP